MFKQPSYPNIIVITNRAVRTENFSLEFSLYENHKVSFSLIWIYFFVCTKLTSKKEEEIPHKSKF